MSICILYIHTSPTSPKPFDAKLETNQAYPSTRHVGPAQRLAMMPMNAQIRAVARLNRWGDYLGTKVGMWTMHYLHQLGWLSLCCEWDIQHINGFGILFTNSIMFKLEFPMAYQAQCMTWDEAMPVGLRQGFFCSKKGHESRDCSIPKPNSAVDGWKELAQRLGKTRCFVFCLFCDCNFLTPCESFIFWLLRIQITWHVISMNAWTWQGPQCTCNTIQSFQTK